ncbi:MAG: YihY/virulence factor BrkB family protein [Candidatus Eremiobacteraeota bacterium]|nr:YihY/virulence factor BrkB family protein [Candidatus Eremiobacteraeota bacterium]MBV8365506.1 YihY/virulence factor BrkB family protein [Candidatus Eremiobacteraeota bacterium]
MTVLREAYQGWNRHHTPHLAAALSFYLAFSLAPLLVIAIAIAGLVLGRQHAAQDVLAPLSAFVGPSGARFLTNLVNGLSKPAPNIIAAAAGIVALVLGASGAFIQLQDALNIVFDAQAQGSSVWRAFQVRFVGFFMVLAIGLVLLAMQILNAGLAGYLALAGQLAPGAVRGGFLSAVGLALSFAVIGVLFALLFRYVPHQRIDWRDALIGGAFTAALFVFGQWAVSMYVAHTALRSIHGAAAAALIIMTWLYYSSTVVFFGAEFTRAFAHQRRQQALPGLAQ